MPKCPSTSSTIQRDLLLDSIVNLVHQWADHAVIFVSRFGHPSHTDRVPLPEQVVQLALGLTSADFVHWVAGVTSVGRIHTDILAPVDPPWRRASPFTGWSVILLRASYLCGL